MSLVVFASLKMRIINPFVAVEHELLREIDRERDPAKLRDLELKLRDAQEKKKDYILQVRQDIEENQNERSFI